MCDRSRESPGLLPRTTGVAFFYYSAGLAAGLGVANDGDLAILTPTFVVVVDLLAAIGVLFCVEVERMLLFSKVLLLTFLERTPVVEVLAG